MDADTVARLLNTPPADEKNTTLGHDTSPAALTPALTLDPDEPDWETNGWPPLLEAAAGKDLRCLELLLSAGASANARNSLGETALHVVIAKGGRGQPQEELSIIRSLLKAGTNANLQEKVAGNTPLHVLCRRVGERSYEASSALNVLKMLLGVPPNPVPDKPVNVNTANLSGCTALHRVVASAPTTEEAVEFVKLLLQHGADPNVRDSRLETPLHISTEHGLTSIVKLFVETPKIDVDSRDRYEQTPLHRAAVHDRFDVCHLLLFNSPNVMRTVLNADLNGDTALHVASGKGHYRIVSLILDLTSSSPAVINVRNNNGTLSIHKAIESGFPEVVRMLLRANSEVLTGQLDIEVVKRHRPEIAQMVIRFLHGKVDECNGQETDL